MAAFGQIAEGVRIEGLHGLHAAARFDESRFVAGAGDDQVAGGGSVLYRYESVHQREPQERFPLGPRPPHAVTFGFVHGTDPVQMGPGRRVVAHDTLTMVPEPAAVLPGAIVDPFLVADRFEGAVFIKRKGGDLGPEHREVASHLLHAGEAAPEAGESVASVAMLRIGRRRRDDADGEGDVFHVDGAKQEGNDAHGASVHLDDPDVGMVALLVDQGVVGEHCLDHALAHGVVHQADDLGKLQARAFSNFWHLVFLCLWEMGRSVILGALFRAGGASFLAPSFEH